MAKQPNSPTAQKSSVQILDDGCAIITLPISERKIKWREPMGQEVETIMGMASISGGIGKAICAGTWLVSIEDEAEKIPLFTQADFYALTAKDALFAVNKLVEIYEFFRDAAQG